MSDTVTNPEGTPEGVEAQEAAKTYSAEYVKELRAESARYRTEKNSAVEAAKAALNAEWEAKFSATQEKSTDLERDLGHAWVDMAKLHAALNADVPSNKVLAFAAILQGSDEDTIKASAESAKELFGGSSISAPAYDPTQGKGGNPLPLNGDPILAALKKAVGG